MGSRNNVDSQEGPQDQLPVPPTFDHNPRPPVDRKDTIQSIVASPAQVKIVPDSDMTTNLRRCDRRYQTSAASLPCAEDQSESTADWEGSSSGSKYSSGDSNSTTPAGLQDSSDNESTDAVFVNRRPRSSEALGHSSSNSLPSHPLAKRAQHSSSPHQRSQRRKANNNKRRPALSSSTASSDVKPTLPTDQSQTSNKCRRTNTHLLAEADARFDTARAQAHAAQQSLLFSVHFALQDPFPTTPTSTYRSRLTAAEQQSAALQTELTTLRQSTATARYAEQRRSFLLGGLCSLAGGLYFAFWESENGSSVAGDVGGCLKMLKRMF